MKTTSALITLLAGMYFMMSCTKPSSNTNNNSNNNNNTNTNPTLSATINGQGLTSAGPYITYDTTVSKVLTITSTVNITGNTNSWGSVVLYITKPSVGTFFVNKSTANFLVFENSSGARYQTTNKNTGSIIVTAFNQGKTISGTFSFTATNSANSADSVIVTNGSFANPTW